MNTSEQNASSKTKQAQGPQDARASRRKGRMTKGQDTRASRPKGLSGTQANASKGAQQIEPGEDL
jgi:hypothetical protein